MVSLASKSGASRPQVSVLIVNYNGAGLLPACLDSLSETAGSDCEVVVVDNLSTDRSLEVLQSYPWVVVVRNSLNSGFAGGNNLGLKHCRGDYVLLLNNDTVAPCGFLQPLLDYLKSNPKVAIVQGKMVLPRSGGTLDACGSFLTCFGLPYHYGYFKPDGPKYQRSYPVFSAKGACMLIRRDLIPQVGGFLFEESFFCYYEETDLCHRAWLAGREVHFVSGPAIQHLAGVTGDRILKFDRVQALYLRNMIFSLLGNLSVKYLIRIMPLFLSVMIFRMVLFLITFNWGQFYAHAYAIGFNSCHLANIWQRRRLISEIRKEKDATFFTEVLRTPQFSYFLHTFRSTIGQFVDQELPR